MRQLLIVWHSQFGGTDSKAFPGSIALFGLLNRVASQQEIVSLQFNPRVVSGTKVFMPLGWNGTGTQPDLSGNGNSGTVTGATVAAHVPLRPLFGVHTVVRVAAAVAATKAMPVFRRSTRFFTRRF